MALTCMECGVGRHLLCQGTRERRGRLEPCSCDCRARITDAERAEAHKRELFKKLRRSNALLREALEVHLPAACDTVSVRMALGCSILFLGGAALAVGGVFVCGGHLASPSSS